MAAKLSEGLGEQVTCPICLEHYSDPRILPCLHTYCRQCLQELLAKGKRKVSVVCPECREEVQIKFGDVTKLKVNFWINNLLSLLAIHSTEQEKDGGKTELTCENCDSKGAAKGRCVNCCVFLCNVCFTAHQRLLALKDHQLVTLDEMKNTGIPVIEKQLFCEKHKGEVQKLFCTSCEEFICRDCTIIDHRDHQFSFLKDVADQHKQLFKQEVERASNTKNEIEADLKSVKKMKENVEKTAKVTEKDIDDLINKQMRALEEKRASLKDTTRKIAAAKMKELAAQEDGLSMHLTGLKSAIEFTEKVLTNGGSSDVLSISKQLTSRLSQLSQKPVAEDQCYEDPWQKQKTRLQFNEKLILESINSIDIADVDRVDHQMCSIAQRIGEDLVNIRDRFISAQEVFENPKFVVTVKNLIGDKLKLTAGRMQVILYEDDLMSIIPITCLPDYTYSFNVRNVLRMLRVKMIHIMVDGKHISGSPFEISLGKKRYR